MNKKVLVIILVTIIFSAVTIYLIKFAEPIISIAAEIKPITAEDYQRIKQNNSSSYSDISSYRHIAIKFKFT